MIIIIFKYFINGLINLPIIFFSIFKHFLIGFWTILTIIPKYFINGLIYIFSKKEKKNEQTNNKPIIPIAMITLSLSIYLLSVFVFSRWYVQNLKIKYLTNDIISSTEIIEKTEEIDEPKDDEPDTPEEPQEPDPEEENEPVDYPNDYWEYMNVPYMDVNFDSLLQTNPDTVAWIKVEGTKINYPVVQSTDNDYYLHHDYRKNDNMAG